MNRLTLGLVAIGALAASGLAQSNLVYDGDFETLDDFTGLPEGWGLFNTARFREVGDGQGEILVRSGTWSLELASGADFVGATTNILNQNTFEYYDPKYVWRGGPCKVSAWYAIPADQPLVGANAGIKLEFRRENSSVYLPFENLSVNGDTGGEWRQISITVGCSEMPDTWPPFPVTVSVLPIRFGAADSTGTIFFDDIFFTQCLADMNCDDQINTQDFIAFLNLWVAKDAKADFNGDGVVNTQDFIAYLNTWTQPCP